MTACKNLIPLQNLDNEIAAAAARIEEKKQKVARTIKEIDADAELVSKKEALLKKIQLRLRKAESDLKTLHESLNVNDLKLRSAGISPAVYKALEKEAERLKQLSGETESKVLEDMGKVETLEKDVPKGKKIIEGRRTHLEQIKQRTAEEINEIKKEMSDLSTSRSQASLKVEADVLEKYEELRHLKKGQVLFPTEAAACPACGMALPGGFVSTISSNEEAELCPNCGVMLYWTGLREV